MEDVGPSTSKMMDLHSAEPSSSLKSECQRCQQGVVLTDVHHVSANPEGLLPAWPIACAALFASICAIGTNNASMVWVLV